jgi:hypothetical protein
MWSWRKRNPSAPLYLPNTLGRYLWKIAQAYLQLSLNASPAQNSKNSATPVCVCRREGRSSHVHLLFSVHDFANRPVCCSCTEILWGKGSRWEVGDTFLLLKSIRRQYQHTFKSLPENLSVLLASDWRSTSGANSSLDSISYKIFSLLDASGRFTMNLLARIST